MPAISIVNTKSFHKGFEIDPEHYHPDRLKALAKLERHSTSLISNYFDEIIDVAPSNTDATANTVFDLTDALDQFLSEGKRVPTINSSKKKAKIADISVSRLRSYLRELCIIPDRGVQFSPLLSTEFIVLRAKQINQGHWLLAFLLSSVVQTVLRWSQTGSNHPRFAAKTLMSLPIPDAVRKTHAAVQKLVIEALKIAERGRTLYPDAEKLLLERFNYEEDKTEKNFIENISLTQSDSRLDAEYFQPKYKRLRLKIATDGSLLEQICEEPHRGTQPVFLPNGTVLVLDSKAIRPQGVQPDPNETTSEEFWASEKGRKAKVCKGDVLLNSTGVGTLGRASTYRLSAKAIADNHVTILRSDQKICLSEYLSLFLNSPLGLAQTQMFQTGSSGQIEIYPHHIQKILIFLPKNKNGLPDLRWQEELADKVQAGAQARENARAKLMKAIEIVDKII